MDSKKNNTKVNQIDRLAPRFEILVDHLFSYYKHLHGKEFHSRLADHILNPDSLTVGKTIEKDCRYRKEHIVPCVYLFQRCFDLIGRGLSESEARPECLHILKKYLKVVIISENKSKELDYQKGLKCTMPTGWDISNGDPYARIKEVYPNLEGIEFYDKDEQQVNSNLLKNVS